MTLNEDDVWFRKPEPLALPLALMGLCVGMFAIDFCKTLKFALHGMCMDDLGALLPRIDGAVEADERLMLGALFALAYGGAGRWVSRKLVMGGDPFKTMLIALFVAGQTWTVVIGLVTLGEDYLVALASGLITTAIIAPFALLMVHNARNAWVVREGSFLHQTYRKARWVDVATGVVILLAYYANPFFGVGYGGIERAIGATVVVAFAAMLATVMAVAAVSGLVRIGRLRGRFDGAENGDAEREGEVPVFDIGDGDERLHDVKDAASAYRHQATIEAVCVGDLKRAWRVIGLSVGRAVGVVAVGALILAVRFQLEMPEYGACY